MKIEDARKRVSSSNYYFIYRVASAWLSIDFVPVCLNEKYFFRQILQSISKRLFYCAYIIIFVQCGHLETPAYANLAR